MSSGLRNRRLLELLQPARLCLPDWWEVLTHAFSRTHQHRLHVLLELRANRFNLTSRTHWWRAGPTLDVTCPYLFLHVLSDHECLLPDPLKGPLLKDGKTAATLQIGAGRGGNNAVDVKLVSLVEFIVSGVKTIFGLDEHLTKPVRLQSRGGYDDYIQGLVAFCGVNDVVPGEPGAQEKTKNFFDFFGRFQWSSSWQGN